MKTSDNKILITGGATGVGLGLTERFLAEGNTVLICGRNEAALKAVTDRFPAVVAYKCDLEVENQRVDLYHWIAEQHSDLNVLVNNAGVQHWMDIADDDFYAKTQQELNINVLAPLHLTRLFMELPALDTVINVTSGLAFVPLARVPVYCGTKAFMRSFTLSLRHLLKERSIEVIEMIPPALNTHLGGQGLHDAFPPVSDFVDAVFAQMKAGKQELTFGSSASRAETNNEAILEYFHMLNP